MLKTVVAGFRRLPDPVRHHVDFRRAARLPHRAVRRAVLRLGTHDRLGGLAHLPR